MAKISVYIVTYNYAKYVDEAIKSVLTQSMTEWELIIINDGSTDNTKSITNKLIQENIVDKYDLIISLDPESSYLLKRNSIKFCSCLVDFFSTLVVLSHILIMH